MYFIYQLTFSSNYFPSDSVTDLTSSIEEVLNDPTLYAHVTKTHDTNIYLIHEHADTSGRRKRRRPAVLDPAHELPVVTKLQQTLDNVQLKSWPCVFDLTSSGLMLIW
jgi:snRNA-activating protein complex subunit 3